MPITVDLIIDALETLGGGPADIDMITVEVLKIAQPPFGKTPPATIRGRLRDHCIDDEGNSRGKALFKSVYGLSAAKGVWALAERTLDPTNRDVVLDGADAFETEEGRAILRTHLRRERSRKLILEFKSSLKEARCEACSLNFSEVYGEYGAEYIEAHHIVPISDLEPGRKTSIKDLAALCANCHRVIHRNRGMSVNALAAYLANPKISPEPSKTWKEAVTAALKRMHSSKASNEITRSELIDAELGNIIADVKSQGMTPTQTLSRVLQELREEGVVEFSDYGGTYKLLF